MSPPWMSAATFLHAPTVYFGRVSAVRDLGRQDGMNRWEADVEVARAFRSTGQTPEKALARGAFTDDPLLIPDGGLVCNSRLFIWQTALVFAESFRGDISTFVTCSVRDFATDRRAELAGFSPEQLRILRCSEDERAAQLRLYDDIANFMRSQEIRPGPGQPGSNIV